MDEDDPLICLTNTSYTNLIIQHDVKSLLSILFPSPKLDLEPLPSAFKFGPLATCEEELHNLYYFGTLLLRYNLISSDSSPHKLFLKLIVEETSWTSIVPILKSQDSLPIPKKVINKLT